MISWGRALIHCNTFFSKNVNYTPRFYLTLNFFLFFVEKTFTFQIYFLEFRCEYIVNIVGVGRMFD